VINKLHRKNIDAGMANDQFFVNVAGAGFDAHVSWMFANAPKRGFWSYTKITLKEFANYKHQSYELTVDGKSITKDAFIICVANGSQYGNNAYIAPQANLDDGLFDISVMKPFKVHQMPLIGMEMFLKKYNNSRYVDALKGSAILIKRPEAGVFNIDGEPIMMEKDIQIKVLPEALKVIVP
jgi:diacylglycerol kinase family enzyme